ncbi:hypothetical protein F5Y15DRAFT_345995 [Xylariaceae sp. FL0016]|nr:hypothetical protein F5Y15DRAFT_345995 [Xylariaceae sp. FL0016]
MVQHKGPNKAQPSADAKEMLARSTSSGAEKVSSGSGVASTGKDIAKGVGKGSPISGGKEAGAGSGVKGAAAGAAAGNGVSGSDSKADTYDKTSAEAVKHQVIKPQEHEDVNTVVDKEVHQDHYKHTVQPVQSKKVLPAQHIQKAGAVEEREVDDRDTEADEDLLEAEDEKFSNKRVVGDTKKTKSQAPIQESKNVHHHYHETVQPVIHEEVIQPQVVHTTKPIHETHHVASKHHPTTTRAPISLEEFEGKASKAGDKASKTGAVGGTSGAGLDTGSGAMSKASKTGASAGSGKTTQRAGAKRSYTGPRQEGREDSESADALEEMDVDSPPSAAAVARHARKDSGLGMHEDEGDRTKYPSLLDKLPSALKPTGTRGLSEEA